MGVRRRWRRRRIGSGFGSGIMGCMAKTTTTKPPIEWETGQSAANRLLGDQGRPLLDDLLGHTQAIAAKRRWPLQRIKVDHYEDPEVDWEYMLITLDFDCPRTKAHKLWSNYLKTVVALEDGLGGEAGDILRKKIHYDFESDP